MAEEWLEGGEGGDVMVMRGEKVGRRGGAGWDGQTCQSLML